MMTFDERRAREIAGQAMPLGKILEDAPEPGVMSGVVSEIPRGAARGAAKVQGLATDLAARAYQPLLTGLEAATDVRAANPFDMFTEASNAAVKQYAPDPMTTGMAGQMVNGVADVLTQVGAGTFLTYLTGGSAAPLMWGGAAVTGAATGRATFNEMGDKGVDPSTAANAAFIDAVTTAGGVLLPGAIGFSGVAGPAANVGIQLGTKGYYAANAAFGVGVNVATGITQRSSISELLESGGYTAMAAQYQPLDRAALGAEAILGGVFSAVGARAGLSSRAGPVVDAALAARDSAHAAIGTAPGIPAEPGAAAAHGRALDAATRALVDGRPVDVGQTGVADAGFVPRPFNPEPARQGMAYYSADIPAAQRYMPSDRLAAVPEVSRRTLRYDAPELNEYAASVEQQYGLPGGLINALKNAGEKSNSNQTSPAGARGVMQFMPENLRKYGVTDPTDPVQMIDAAGKYLRDTMRQYGGDVDAMIADYNGGPRQAREVLAGRQPKAKETRDYLARVREWMGRDTYAQRQDVTGDTLPGFPAERAQTASRIEQAIAEGETTRGELVARAGGEAELGAVTTMRTELDSLIQQRESIDADGAVRALAKEIQSSETQVSYKQALSRARRESEVAAKELDVQIDRLQSQVDRNAQANQAAQEIAVLDRQLAGLRDNRAVIDAPAVRLNPIAGVLEDSGITGDAARSVRNLGEGGARSSTGEMPARQADSVEPMRTEIQQRENSATPAAVGRAPSEPAVARTVDQVARERSGATQPVDDIETRAGLALLDEQGDIILPMTDAQGNDVPVSLRQALAEANAELDYSPPEAFNAAVLCRLTKGS